MTPPFRALRANNVDTDRESLGHVLGGTDHVHNGDSRGVKLIDSPFGRDANGRHKEAAFFLDHDWNERSGVSNRL